MHDEKTLSRMSLNLFCSVKSPGMILHSIRRKNLMRNFIISNFSHVRVKVEGIHHEPRAVHRWQRATKWREGICSYTRTSFLPQKRTNTAQLLTESFRSKFRPKFSLPTLSSPESPPVFTWLDFPKENMKSSHFTFPFRLFTHFSHVFTSRAAPWFSKWKNVCVWPVVQLLDCGTTWTVMSLMLPRSQ